MNTPRRRPLSLGNLRAFEAVARRLSFSEAAEELFVTQSAISRQIKGLEDELGAPLFERTGRGVTPTAAALAIADAARRARTPSVESITIVTKIRNQARRTSPLKIARIAQALSTDDELVIARCDLDWCARYQHTLFDFDRYRRPEVYGRITAQAAKPAAKAKLLTLTEISKLAGISYPTLVRYVKAYADRLPHEGKGRARRFYQEAVNVFRQLRNEGGKGGRKPAAAAAQPAAKRRGRPPGSGKKAAAAPAPAQDAGLVRRLREIEKAHLDLEKRFRDFAKGLQKLFR